MGFEVGKRHDEIAVGGVNEAAVKEDDGIFRIKRDGCG